jgi:hypothetical protein
LAPSPDIANESQAQDTSPWRAGGRGRWVGLRFRPSQEAIAWRRAAAGSGELPGCSTRWSVRSGPARPGRPRQPGQPCPFGDWPRWSVRGRLQAISRSSTTRPVRAAVAWPLPSRPCRASRVVQGRPGRPGPARPGCSSGADHGGPWRPGPLGQGRHGGCASGTGPAPAKHASRTPGGAGTRTDRWPSRPGPAPLSRRRLTPAACWVAIHLAAGGQARCPGLKVPAADPRRSAPDRPGSVGPDQIDAEHQPECGAGCRTPASSHPGTWPYFGTVSAATLVPNGAWTTGGGRVGTYKSADRSLMGMLVSTLGLLPAATGKAAAPPRWRMMAPKPPLDRDLRRM